MDANGEVVDLTTFYFCTAIMMLWFSVVFLFLFRYIDINISILCAGTGAVGRTTT